MVFKMAHLSARAHGNLLVLFPRVIKPSFFTGKSNAISRISEGVFSGLNVLQSREFKPYSVTPKKFLKKKNRNKSDRDNVYFTTDQVDPSYSISDAIDIIKAYDLFGNEKLDLILKMDLGEGKNKVAVLKGLVHLPTPVTERQKVLVFAEGEDANKALENGAAIVGGKELIPQVENGELEFDHCISTIDFLPNIKHLPKILRNKMPNTRRGTATDDIEGALKVFSHGESYIADNTGRLRQTIALSNFTREEIHENLVKMMEAVDEHKKSASLTTDKFYKQVGLVLPAGPKINLNVSDVAPP